MRSVRVRVVSIAASGPMAALALLLAVSSPAAARAAGAPAPPAPGARAAPPVQGQAQSTPEGEAEVRSLIEAYYRAYGRKEASALVAAWHPDAPGVKGMAQALGRLFDAYDVAFDDLDVSAVTASVAGGGARVRVTVTWTPAGGGPGRVERWVRNQGFLQKDGVWKYWRDEPASQDLAVRMIAANSDAERESLVPSDATLIDTDLLRALEGAGHRLRDRGRFDEAIETYAFVRRLAERVGHDAEAARAQADIGLVHLRLQRWAIAYDEFAAARRILEPLGDRLQTALCDLNMGHARYAEADYVEAEARFGAAHAALAALGEEAWTSSALHSLGNARYARGDLVKAAEAYDAALAVQSRLRDRVAAASLQQALGLVRRDQGDFPAALAAYAEALAGYRAASYLAGIVPSFQGLAETYRLQGQLDLALANARAGLTAAEQIGDTAGQAELAFDLGRILASERRFAEATASYGRSLAIERKAGDRAGVARSSAALGMVAFAERRYDRALELYRESLDIRRELGDSPRIAWTEIHVGLALEAKTLHQEAVDAYLRALAIHESSGDAKGVAIALALVGDAKLGAVDTAGAREFAARAIAIAGEANDLDTLAHARLIDGKAARLAGDLDGARASLEAAAALVDRRTAEDADIDREPFFGDLGAPDAALADLAVARDRPAEALAWAERARARLLRSIVGRSGAAISKGLSGDERTDERRLSRQVRSLHTQAARERERAAPDAGRLATLESALASTRAALAAHREALYDRHPDLKAMRGGGEPPPMAELAAPERRHGAALVEFLQNDSRLLALVLPAGARRSGGSPTDPPADPPAEVASFVIDIAPADLASMVAAFRSAIESRAPDLRRQARALYDLVMAPAEKAVGRAGRLIVVPDGVLWALPFEALVDASDRYLIERLTVSYAPSIARLRPVQRRAPDRRVSGLPTGPIVALADPLVAPDTAARLRLAYPGLAWDRQPQAHAEARRLVSLFGAGRVEASSGELATRSRLIESGTRASLLHLAVPLVMNDSSPLFSELVLAASPAAASRQPTPGAATASGESRPAERREPVPTLPALLQRAPSAPPARPSAGESAAAVPELVTEEGTLSLAALAEADLGAEAAVFTRATPSSGAPETGGAIVALDWALEAAGVESLAVSRWPAERASSPAFTAAIYRALRPGSGTADRASSAGLAEAVRRAAIEALRRPETADPRDWAGLLVIDRFVR